MSKISSVTKVYTFERGPLKTPNIKKESNSTCPAERNKDPHTHTTIIMDEYGQTPDHYYLARKPPPSFFQAKRKLHLESSQKMEKPRRRKLNSVAKPKGKTLAEKARYDTSLGQLTKKFLELLSDASDGVVNLNDACAMLSVPKRRLYDITNVLEGAGLVQKTSRNNIQWMGRVKSPVIKCNLEQEIDVLESKENKLDELIYHMTSEIDANKKSDQRYHYVTPEDIQNISEFSGKQVIGITNFQFVEIFEKKLTISNKSKDVEGFLLHDDAVIKNLLGPKAELKENSYDVKIENSRFVLNSGDIDAESSNEAECLQNLLNSYTSDSKSNFSRISTRTMWSEGDRIIKNAFIAEEDDIAPMGKNFLLQTEDQDIDSFVYSGFDAPVDSYSFSLDTAEGLSDLFDCNFTCS